MSLLKNVVKSGLALVSVLIMTAGAYAWPATATTAVNVRSGPGTNYRVVSVLQRGQRVEVNDCRGSWCFIQGTRGSGGWVSSSYLNQSNSWRPQPSTPSWNNGSNRPPHWNNGPNRPPNWNNGPNRPPHWNNGPNRPPNWNNGPNRPPHGGNRPPQTGGQICFNGPNGYVCVGK